MSNNHEYYSGLFVLYKAQKTGEYIDFKMDRKIIEDNILNGRRYS
jgi:hypothetical protein